MEEQLRFKLMSVKDLRKHIKINGINNTSRMNYDELWRLLDTELNSSREQHADILKNVEAGKGIYPVQKVYNEVNVHIENKIQDVKENETNSNDLIPSNLIIGKYNISEMLKDIRKTISIACHLKDCEARRYIDAWLFDNHYTKTKLSGNLTVRIMKIRNYACYREIIKRCFDGFDFEQHSVVTQISLSNDSIDIIKDLHSISPNIIGSFLDFLVRRVISEIKKIPLNARRESESTNDIITDLDNKECIDNPYLIKCDFVEHICLNGCNMNIYADGEDYELPICRKFAYYKSENILKYASEDICKELFVSSLGHSEMFGDTPGKDKIEEILKYIDDNTNKIKTMIKELKTYLSILIESKSEIKLNPCFGNSLRIFKESIPSDGDLLIDDELIEIKCTVQQSSSKIYEILQLLGYSALSYMAVQKNKQIKKMSILNLYYGTYTTYDIKHLEEKNYVSYLKVLFGIK